jgi:hypothetical protein
MSSPLPLCVNRIPKGLLTAIPRESQLGAEFKHFQALFRSVLSALISGKGLPFPITASPDVPINRSWSPLPLPMYPTASPIIPDWREFGSCHAKIHVWRRLQRLVAKLKAAFIYIAPPGGKTFVANKGEILFDRTVTERSKGFLCPFPTPNRVSLACRLFCFQRPTIGHTSSNGESTTLPFIRLLSRQKSEFGLKKWRRRSLETPHPNWLIADYRGLTAPVQARRAKEAAPRKIAAQQTVILNERRSRE